MFNRNMINIGPSQRIASGGNDSRQTRASRYSHNSTTGRGIRMSKQQYDEMVAYYKYINSLVILSTPIEGSSLMVSSDGLYNTFQTYQDKFTTAGTYITLNGNTLSSSLSTTNAITNGSVNALILSPFTTALEGKQNTISVGSGISFANNVLSLLINNQVLAKSSNLVDSNGIYNMLNLKQTTLIPTADFSLVANSLSLATTKDSVPIRNSTNLVTSGGIYNALLSKLPTTFSLGDGLSMSNTTNTNTITYKVTVSTKTNNHLYIGQGSGLGYYINGLESPLLDFQVGHTYIFDQSDSTNATHPLSLYLDNNKGASYTTNVSFVGTAGQSGAYLQLIVTSATPSPLFYQCQNHPLMGTYGVVKPNALNSLRLVKDAIPTENSINLVDSNSIFTALSLKQDPINVLGGELLLTNNNLTLVVNDTIPSVNSPNLVPSSGIYSEFLKKQDNLQGSPGISLVGNTFSITKDNVPSSGSTNLIDSNGIYNALSTKQDNVTIVGNGLSLDRNNLSLAKDAIPIQNSGNLVDSHGVYTALTNKQYLLTIPETNLSLTGTTLSIVKDTVPTPGSVNLIDSSGIYGLITGKQNFLKVTENGGLSFSGNTIQFSLDSTPQQGSDKLVTSGGIYTAFTGKQNIISIIGNELVINANTLSILAKDNIPVQNSENLVSSGGIYNAFSEKQDIISIDGGGLALVGNTLSLVKDNLPTQNSKNLVDSSGIYSALSTKQDNVTIVSNGLLLDGNKLSLVKDSIPIQNSGNLVDSSGLFHAFSKKINNIEVDGFGLLFNGTTLAAVKDLVPTQSSGNLIDSSGIHYALSLKQDNLNIDGSGLLLNGSTLVTVKDLVPTQSSGNLIDSSGIYYALSLKLDNLNVDGSGLLVNGATMSIIKDSIPTQSSGNLIDSSGIYYALSLKQDNLNVDGSGLLFNGTTLAAVKDLVPTSNSGNLIDSSGIHYALSLKQDNLNVDGYGLLVNGATISIVKDSIPTQSSGNLIDSSGIYYALSLKQDNLNVDGSGLLLNGNTLAVVKDEEPTSNSGNLIDSSGVYTAISKKQSPIVIDGSGLSIIPPEVTGHIITNESLTSTTIAPPSNTNVEAVSVNADGTVLAAVFKNTQNNTWYVGSYSWNGSSWSLKGNTINTGRVNDIGINWEGDRISFALYSIGSAYVYEYNPNSNTWGQLGNAMSVLSSGFEWFTKLNKLGDVVAFSLAKHDINGGAVAGFGHGVVYTFQYNSSTNNWDQLGSPIQPSNANFQGDAYSTLGWRIDISSDGYVLVIGIPYMYKSSEVGIVRVYYYNGSSWIQRGSDLQRTPITPGNFGRYVSMNGDGTRIAITNIYDNVGEIYDWNGTSWTQFGSDISISSGFLRDIILNADGDYVLISVTLDNNSFFKTYIYKYSNGSWQQTSDSISTYLTTHEIHMNEFGGVIVGRSSSSPYSINVFRMSYTQRISKIARLSILKDTVPIQNSENLLDSNSLYTAISSLFSVGTGLSLDLSTNTLSAVAPYLYITLNPYLSGATNTTTSGTISVGMNSLLKAFADDSTYSSHFEVYSIGSDSISYTNGNDYIEILKDGYYEIKCDLTVIKQTSAQLFSVGYSLLTVLSGNSTYRTTSHTNLNMASGSSVNNKLSQSLHYIGYFSKDTQLKIVSANSSEQTLIADLDIVYDPNNTAERVVPFFSVERLG